MKKQIIISVLIVALAILAWKGNAQDINNFTTQVVIENVDSLLDDKNIVLAIVYNMPEISESNPNETQFDTTGFNNVVPVSPIPDNLTEINVLVKDSSSTTIITKTISFTASSGIRKGFNVIKTSVGILQPNEYVLEVYLKNSQNTSSQTQSVEFIVYK
jgi:hypothetical protein